MDWVIGEFVFLAAPLYFFLQALMALRYRGRWLLLSLLPLLVMVPLAAQSAFAFAGGSNLWPLPVILSAPFACSYLLGLAIVKAIVA
jgi:hypothetical protein